MVSSINQYYCKQGNRYIPIGYNGPKLYNGIWIVQNDGSRQTSVSWLVGDLPDPVDTIPIAALMQMEDDFVKFLMEKNISMKTHEDYDTIHYASHADTSKEIIRFIAGKLQHLRLERDGKKDSLQFETADAETHAVL